MSAAAAALHTLYRAPASQAAACPACCSSSSCSLLSPCCGQCCYLPTLRRCLLNAALRCPALPCACSAIPVRFKLGVEGPEGVEVLLITSRRGKGYVFPKVR